MSLRTAGRYVLEEVIGAGSFATVHRARDPHLDDTVVVKILAENHSLNPEIRERFIAEGRSLRRVRSRHVVTVHDIGESDRQQPYLVLELADRGTLAERVADLRSRGWTPVREDVLVLARQLAKALEAVHQARLVHRDLSPRNVLLTTVREDLSAGGTGPLGRAPSTGSQLVAADEQILLADLGMCKDLAVSSGLTVAGGTSGFRPPEMEGGPAVVDARTDLWSLSALVEWLCEGADLPDGLARALARSRATDPEERHPDVASWLADVEAALAPPPEPVAPTAGRDAPDGTVTGEPAQRRTRAWRWPLAALLAAVLGLGLGWALSRDASPPEATSVGRIAIEGPEEVSVGSPVTLTLRHLGTEHWTWVLPTGEQLEGDESVTLTPTGAGRARVVVHALDTEGEPLRVEHEVTVTAP